MAEIKAGIVPYYVNQGQVFVYLMVPSNANYGGLDPQIAKGGVENGQSVEETAVREGEEELGLKRANIASLQVAWRGTITGLATAQWAAPVYELIVYMAGVKNPQDFGQFHYETGWAGWIGEQDISRVRSNQRAIISAVIQKAKNNPQMPKIEHFKEWLCRNSCTT